MLDYNVSPLSSSSGLLPAELEPWAGVVKVAGEDDNDSAGVRDHVVGQVDGPAKLCQFDGRLEFAKNVQTDEQGVHKVGLRFRTVPRDVGKIRR